MSGSGSDFHSYYNDTSPLTTAATSASTQWSTTQDTFIGNRSDTLRPFSGNISQIVVFDEQLTGSDLTNVQQALSDKWGLGVTFGGDANAGNALLESPPSTIVEATNVANNFVNDQDLEGEGTSVSEVNNFAPPTGRYFGESSTTNRAGFYVFQLPAIPAGEELTGGELNAFLNSNTATLADGTLNLIGLRASPTADQELSDYQNAFEAGASNAADFDSNDSVDGKDFLAWQRGLGTDAGTGNVAPEADGNANGDQFVDGTDLGIWENEFGTTGGSEAVVIESDWADSTTPASNSALPVINESSNPALLTFLQDAYEDVGAGGYVFFGTTVDTPDLTPGPVSEHGFRIRGGKAKNSFNPMTLHLSFQPTVGAVAGASVVPEPSSVALVFFGLCTGFFVRQRTV